MSNLSGGERMTQKFQEFLKQKKWRNLKKSDWVALALAGVLILIIAMPTGNSTMGKKDTVTGALTTETKSTETEKKENAADDYTTYLEKKLEEVLSQMEGVGEVKVMITVSDSGESVVAKDRTDHSNTVTENDSSGGSRTSTERQYSSSTVFVEQEKETFPYVEKELMPSIEGVVVVAEGGENSKVASDIYEAVQALFPVEAHRIKVVKMCSKEESK